MKFFRVTNRAKQAIDRLTERLRKEFPEGDGAHAVVFGQAPDVDMGSQHYGNPHEDKRPDFVKADDIGWTKIR